MTFNDAVSYAIACLLLIQAALRVPAALKGRIRRRSLWGAFAALAAAWLTRTGPGFEFIASFGVPDIGYLVKHTLAIVGICVLLRYITAVYATADPAADIPRSARISAAVYQVATRASVATVATMTTVFFAGLSHPDTSTLYFMERYAGHPWLAVYMGLFYSFMGAAAAVCAVQWGGAVRHAPMRSLRIGLTMMSAAMVLAVLYALLRTVYVVLITVHPVSTGFADGQETVTDTLLYAVFLLWLLGAITPTARAASTRYRTMSDLRALHPLWRDLATTAPDVVRRRPSQLLPGRPLFTFFNTSRDLLSYDNSPVMRLGRYVTEIRDVIHELRRHAPDELAERARLHAERSGLGAGSEIKAEAYWIRAARAVFSGRPAGPPAPFPFQAGDSIDTEVPHLRAVAVEYGRIKGSDVRDILGGPPTAQPPAPAPS